MKVEGGSSVRSTEGREIAQIDWRGGANSETKQ